MTVERYTYANGSQSAIIEEVSTQVDSQPVEILDIVSGGIGNVIDDDLSISDLLATTCA